MKTVVIVELHEFHQLLELANKGRLNEKDAKACCQLIVNRLHQWHEDPDDAWLKTVKIDTLFDDEGNLKHE